jgi:hypothetical protein
MLWDIEKNKQVMRFNQPPIKNVSKGVKNVQNMENITNVFLLVIKHNWLYKNAKHMIY